MGKLLSYRFANNNGYLQQKGRYASQRGAVLMEFIIVAPLLLVFFSGLLFAGSLLAQLSWITQANYQTALIGGESPENLAYGRMEQRLNTFVSILGKDLKEDSVEYTREIVPHSTHPSWRDVKTGIRSPLVKLGPIVPIVSRSIHGPFVANAVTIEGLGDFPSAEPTTDWGSVQVANPDVGTTPMNYSSEPVGLVAEATVIREHNLAVVTDAGNVAGDQTGVGDIGGIDIGSGRP
jgi:hypothetical protein